jgi:transmembrane sensor
MSARGWPDAGDLRHLPADIDEAAARWSEILRDAGDDGEARAAFQAWQARSPRHAAAFKRVQSAQALVHSLADAPQLQALRDQTRARTAALRRRCSRRTYRFAIAASLFLVALTGALLFGPDSSRQLLGNVHDAFAGNVYRTGIGQRIDVTLDDGSILTLNTDSRVSVHYEGAVRAVTLERGQALFKVAKDRTRPFVVTAGGRQVTALGTEFEVRLGERLFEVTLLEGRVTVTRHPAAPTEKPAALDELRPGQQFIAVAKAPPRVRPADVRRAVSWRNGQVVFEDERLDAAVAEMNRYSRRKVVLDDHALATLKISGAFNTGDTRTFVEALTLYFPIEHDARDEGTIVLKPRPPKRG